MPNRILIHLQEKARIFLRGVHLLRTVGIVCEFNPFHKGHLYLLEESRRRLGGDVTTVCVMSGDYVQRGEGAYFDKFVRAEAACRCGADLVLELPLPWSLSSAEGFASGAVAMLSAVGCDAIAFGSESGNADSLDQLADFLLDPYACAQIYRRMDEDGSLSFAAARQRTAEKLLGPEAALLSHANDILAVEYLKAVKKQKLGLHTLAIPRKGEGHDSMDGGTYRSAMQLREMLKRGEDVSLFIPDEAMAVFKKALKAGKHQNAELFETALFSRLYRMEAEDFDKLPDAGGGAGRRLYKALQDGGGIEQIAVAASSKRYTVARMRRMLLCAALGIQKEDADGAPPYLRVLAASGQGRELLHREKGKAPFLIKPASVRRLDTRSVELFQLIARAHDLYRLCCADLNRFRPGQDWEKSPILV